MRKIMMTMGFLFTMAKVIPDCLLSFYDTIKAILTYAEVKGNEIIEEAAKKIKFI